MRINGEGIYGSKAWVKFGEGAPGPTAACSRCLRMRSISRRPTSRFGPTDFRFTVGRDGSLYAFALAVPQPGATVTIASFGSSAGLLTTPIRSVTLVGSRSRLVWSQRPEGLVITAPHRMPSQIAVAFRIQ